MLFDWLLIDCKRTRSGMVLLPSIGELPANRMFSYAFRLKNGDIYVGNLNSYPILPDSADSKDFRLGDSVFYPAGDINSAEDLKFSEYDGGGVLLNTSNVSSIEYMYHDNYKTSDQE